MPWVWLGTAKGKRIDYLKRQHQQMGDRRDWQGLEEIEAELYKLTGDVRWVPYSDDEDEKI